MTPSRFSKSLVAALMSAVLAVPVSFAKEEADADGIKVDKGSRLSKLVPAEQLEAAAAQQYSGLKADAQRQGKLLPESDPRVQRVRRIAQELIPHAKRWNAESSRWKWEVNVFDSKQINAFCMPGGKIAFFTGIIDTLKLTDDELAIVMGHEIAHALREHARERVAKSTAVQLGASLLGSMINSDLGRFAVNQGGQLMVLKFSRGNESDADIVGLDVAARAGFDPRAGIALWKKMGQVNNTKPLEWFSTHPAGDNRIAEMQKRMPEVLPVYAKVKGKKLNALPPYQTNVKSIGPIS